MELVLIAIFLFFLFYLSLVESAITQSSPLVLRMMTEHSDHSEPPLLSAVLEDKMQVLVPLHLGIQISILTTAILITHLSITLWPGRGLVISFAIAVLVSVLFRQSLPRLLTQNKPEEKLSLLLQSFRPVYAVLRTMALPISGLLKLYKRLHEQEDKDHEPEPEETTEEEIQAYLEIGENEGILQEEDSKLIQSVVEFGNTLVREVMTPRTKMVACVETATVGELRETMVQFRHSRIPIYRGDIDHIIGIAYIRQLVAEYVKGRDSDPITTLINPVLFVPETKPVSKLLKELQERADHVAIVIDEYGGVAGLATIEDLVEEIIGEIRDEDEAKVSKIIEEGTRTYLVRASTELSRVEELTGRRFENQNCSTVAGLIMAYLGRVPARGEVFDLEGITVRIVDSDRKRLNWVRIQLPESPAEKGKSEGSGSKD
jgi:putative hemolysin